MKKLMVAVLAIAAGLVANASTFKWSIDESYVKGSSSIAEGYAVYFFDTRDLSYATAQSNLASGDWSFLSNQSGTAVRYTDEDGAANGQSKRTDYAASTTYDGYVIILNADKIADATYAYLQNGSGKMPDMEGGTGTMKLGSITGMKSDATVTSGNGWYAAVPEPTSGLLLLLGMAGLALRRRRA